MMFVPSLTAIRGFAALWVVLLHLRYAAAAEPYGVLAPIFARGYLGVPIFFVLSGFILAHVHRSDFNEDLRKSGRFIWMRFCRVYPLHLITLVGSVFILTRTAEDTPASFLYNLLLIHAWGPVTGVTWNLPSWSVSSEWFAYLLFPLLAFAMRGWGWRPNLLLMLACLAFHPYTARLFPPTVGFQHGLSALSFFLMFMIGFCAHGVARVLPDGRLWAFAPVAALVAVVGVAYLPPWVEFYWNPTLCMLLIVSLFKVPCFLSWRPIVYFGEISYALYLSHILSFTLIRNPFYGVMQNLFLEIAGCVLIAAALHHLDAPVGRWLRAAWRRDYRLPWRDKTSSPSEAT
jgi:peptidoglycan/LPS O-acetylase OafA/YrhL